jgi:hypothetical protein
MLSAAKHLQLLFVALADVMRYARMRLLFDVLQTRRARAYPPNWKRIPNAIDLGRPLTFEAVVEFTLAP